MKRIIILALAGAIAVTALASIPRDNLRAPAAETATPIPAQHNRPEPVRAEPTAPAFEANTPTPDAYPAPATISAYPAPVEVPETYVTPTPP